MNINQMATVKSFSDETAPFQNHVTDEDDDHDKDKLKQIVPIFRTLLENQDPSSKVKLINHIHIYIYILILDFLLNFRS